MRIAIIGQQDFGKAVMEAFLARGDTVAGVFVAPEKEGGKPDPMKVAAVEKGLTVFQFPSLKAPEATAAMQGLDADIGIMAFVLQFAPQEFVNIPRHGTIQYHPSLLPKYRGPSSINWPITKGETKTGLTIFRPTDGLDEGAVIAGTEGGAGQAAVAQAGFALAGIRGAWFGAGACLVAVFLPGMLVLVGALPFWARLRQRAALRSAVAGINAGVVGVLFAAWIDPVSTSALRSVPDVAVAIVLVVLLMRLRWTPLAVVAAAVALGAVRALVAA